VNDGGLRPSDGDGCETALSYAVIVVIRESVFIIPFVIRVCDLVQRRSRTATAKISSNLLPSPVTTDAFPQLFQDQDFLCGVEKLGESRQQMFGSPTK